MPAYQVAIVRITNRTPGFMEYVQKSAALLKQHGGEYLVRGPAESVAEGEIFKGVSVIVTKWASMDKAKAFIHSEEYATKIKPLREGAGVFDIGLFPEAPK